MASPMRSLRPSLPLVIPLLWLPLACAPAPAAPAPAAAPAPPGTETKPASGGVFRIGIHSDLNSFDIATEGGGLNLPVDGLVQSGLMKWAKEPILDQSKVLCDLCESWRQVNDTLYEFKLRQGIKWHNVPPVNGREFVAADIKYTIERIQNLGFNDNRAFGRHLSKVQAINQIETPDKYTLRITMKEPQATALMNFGDAWILMVAREQVETEPDGVLLKGLIGTGPFVLKEFIKKSSYTLVRNPDYFEKGLPYLDGIEVRVIPDTTTRFNAFRAGEIHDPGFFMDAEKKRIIDRQHPALFMGRAPEHITSGFFFNHTRKPFDDLRVRKAMYLAFDRQGLIDATRFGEAQLTRWVGTPGKGLFATPEQELEKMPGFRQPKDQDIAEARRLLVEAGFPNGFKTSMVVVKRGDIEANAEVFAEQMRKALNVEIALQPLEAAVHAKTALAGEFEMDAEFTGSEVDPGLALWFLYGGNPQNVSRYKNPAFDELMDRQQRALDVEVRRKLFFQMYEILDRDVPAIPAYTDYAYKGFPKRCHAISEEPRYNTLVRYMSEAWCEPGLLK